jgi:hypothetical protein
MAIQPNSWRKRLRTPAAAGSPWTIPKPVRAAIVPVQVAAEIEAAEDAPDIAAAEAAMAEHGHDVPAEAVWAGLGIADDE